MDRVHHPAEGGHKPLGLDVHKCLHGEMLSSPTWFFDLCPNAAKASVASHAKRTQGLATKTRCKTGIHTQTLHGTAIGLPIRPGMVWGSMGRHIWQSHGVSGTWCETDAKLHAARHETAGLMHHIRQRTSDKTYVYIIYYNNPGAD